MTMVHLSRYQRKRENVECLHSLPEAYSPLKQLTLFDGGHLRSVHIIFSSYLLLRAFVSNQYVPRCSIKEYSELLCTHYKIN